LGLLLLFMLSAGGCRRTAPPQAPFIAAAADLQFALEEVSRKFTAETGMTVNLSFGSSGTFMRQIEQGAPFQLFLSADEGTLYATGRIGVFAAEGSPLKADGSLKDLQAALLDGRVKAFAIANPQHAPYGKRAQEALEKAGLWQAIQPHLVLGENVSQAAQFVLSGNAQGGIIAYSLARAPQVSTHGRFELIPENCHEPLSQRMVRLKGAGATAQAFYRYLQQPSARTILQRYGFILPGERP
jgi:molybdate transport system substrate-binding protein